MYNLFHLHNMSPDDVISKSEIVKKLLFAFSAFEIEELNKK